MSEIYLSPIGVMGIKRSHDVFSSIQFGDFTGLPIAVPELDNYFRGHQKNVVLPTELLGTPFQIQVWQKLLTIPYGQRVSYQQIANQVGMPQAVRAVANAISKNPLHIILPCHRVVHSNGSLGGYRGGTIRKKQLLNLESQRMS